MRSAISRVFAFRGWESFVKDLDHDVSLADELEVRVEQGACSRAWFHRFCSLTEYLAPSAVLPIRENLAGILGHREGVFLSWGGGVSGGPSRGQVFRCQYSGACSG